MDISAKISVPGAPAAYQNPSRRIILPSGGIFVFPQGNYNVKCGPQTAIQQFNTFEGLWHIMEGGGSQMFQFSADGTNYRAINLSGTVAAYSVTNSGSGYSQGTISVTISGSFGQAAAATAIVGGNITAVVSTAGTGYVNPIVTIQDPWEVGQVTQPFSLPALATATITSTTGQIGSINFQFAGAGYPGNPVITISDPAGTGAVVNSQVASPGKVTAIIPTNYGYNWSAPPTCTINAGAGGGSSATATALPWLAVQAGTVSAGGQGVTGLPVMVSSLGIVAPSPNGETWLVRPAKLVSATMTGTGGSVGISTTTVEDAGGGFQTAPVISVIAGLASAGTLPSVVASVGGVNNELEYWQIG